MIAKFYRLLIELTNHRFSSFILKKVAQSKYSRHLIPAYSKAYHINHSEIERDLSSFNSLHEFFIRQLKEGSRPVNDDETSVVSPVDAVIEEVGIVSAAKSIEVKGKTYSVTEMLGNEQALTKYIGGTFIILYLSPSHYHRIHSPITGQVTKQWLLGKKSYPVNRLGLKYGKDTLSKNYRVITEVQYDQQHLAIVKVGAMFVNSIETTHQRDLITKGEEIAYFTFGSTVILLFEENTFEISPEIQVPYDIKVGEVLGHTKK